MLQIGKKYKGRVCHTNKAGAYFFIQITDNTGRVIDVFAHLLQTQARKLPEVDDLVVFTLSKTTKGYCADNVKVLEDGDA